MRNKKDYLNPREGKAPVELCNNFTCHSNNKKIWYFVFSVYHNIVYDLANGAYGNVVYDDNNTFNFGDEEIVAARELCDDCFKSFEYDCSINTSKSFNVIPGDKIYLYKLL